MANGPAWYFGESIGEAQGAKRAAEQQYLNLALANRNFDQEQQARIDRQAAAQYEAGRQNYLTGLAQAQQRRSNALRAAQIRATAGQQDTEMLGRLFQQDRQHRAAQDRAKAIQERFNIGQQNQTQRAIDAAKAAEGVREQARAARDEQAFFNNLAKDPTIRNRTDLSAAMANLNVGPERMDMVERSLAGRQRRAADLRNTAQVRADEWNAFADRLMAGGKGFDEVVIYLKGNPQDSSLVEPDFAAQKFVARRSAAHGFGTDALDYFLPKQRPVRYPLPAGSEGASFPVNPGSNGPSPFIPSPVTPTVTPPPQAYFPPAMDEEEEMIDPDDPGGFF